jgi:hypothetical protein
MDKYIVIVELDNKTCPWLRDEVVKVGTIVTETSDNFGCCGPGGVFVEYQGMRCPTELPREALKPLDEAKPEKFHSLN